ncbi:hypothetical protein ADUPG1_007559, partial [Aduncisulcus paluster]
VSNGPKPLLARVSYADLKTGQIEIEGKKVRTAPITSLTRSREIADLLKERILDGSFELQKPIEFFPQKSNYGLRVNILKASIDINLQGHMLAEVEGQSEKIGQAIEYLEKVGIEADFVKSTIQRLEEKCVDCGLCTT